MKSLQTFTFNRENAVLVIVDMQNEFCKPGGKLYNETSSLIIPQVISANRRLAGRARGAGIPVIYIRGCRTLREPEFTVFGVPPHLELGGWGAEIVDELKPEPGDTVIQKFSHDPFYDTEIDRILQKLVYEPAKCHAVVTGGAVNVCHYHAVMGFHVRGYWTVVPVDSVYYFSDADNQRALEQFSHMAYPNIFLSRSDLVKTKQL
ncbi:MAG: isochorismatase family cysteine hydrolase [Dehalococcoidia bacterium]|nr:isochorismatase family cysteine hydrolase [Dehalococcoidia bacterium]